jgi:maleylpyruvate isomerase
VRIVLNLKGLRYDNRYHHLRRNAQNSPEYLALNPQGLLPTLEVDGAVLTQSLAICEFLEEAHPEHAILPADIFERARIRAFANIISCDIHPLQNLKILARLRALGLDEGAVNQWAATVIEEGLAACAKLIAGHDTPFCYGESPSLADVCLVPQLVNARRFGVEIIPRLAEIERRCLELPAFAQASPEQQGDWE